MMLVRPAVHVDLPSSVGRAEFEYAIHAIGAPDPFQATTVGQRNPLREPVDRQPRAAAHSDISCSTMRSVIGSPLVFVL